MNVISSFNDSLSAPSVVALGCFDGVHLGHAAVLNAAVETARAAACPCTVFTFDEPPKNFFAPASVSLLTDPQEKQLRMAQLGVNTLVSIPFNESICNLSAEDFFREILCRRLHAVHIVCGYNYTFGRGGVGNTALLQQLCREADIGLTVIPSVTVNGMTVSSSAIRQALAQGEPQLAAALLGRPYALRAEVVHGQQLATTLGFPTANQHFPKGRTVPKAGVYGVRVTSDASSDAKPTVSFGISNVGIRPTVSDHTLCCETHLFDCAASLYGTQLTVEFLAFLRPEQKFSSIEALAQQVHADIAKAKTLLQG